MAFSSTLRAATTVSDGGVRSFPVAHDDTVRRYQAPTPAYQKLFFFQASQSSQSTPDYSAGWLIADQQSACNPVFVAHSLLCAIALIRDTLPPDALHDDVWAQLVSAAVTLSASAHIPPSAQPAPSTTDGPSYNSLPRMMSPVPSASSPKRRRLNLTTPEPTLAVDEMNQSPTGASEAGSPPPATPQDYVVTVSNNNRRAERERAKKSAVAAARKKCSIGLLEPAESAEAGEKIAYHGIEPRDHAHVAWIIKQRVGEHSDFYQGIKSPYLTATKMLAKARAVGSPSTWQNLAAFLRAWRENGTPVPGRSITVVASQNATQPHPSGRNNAFQQAWRHSCVYQDCLATVAMEYRWAMAFLGRAYHAQIAKLPKDQPYVKTEVIDSLWFSVESAGTEQGRKRFVRRLAQATRWYQIAKTLGWGSLCLLPDSVSNKWVKSCPAPAWPIWLELITRVNPEACTASRALDAWIGQKGIEGGAIQGQEKLYIEEKGPAYQVEEVVDSTDDESSDVESSAQPVKSSARRLRQLTLLELFKPQ